MGYEQLHRKGTFVYTKKGTWVPSSNKEVLRCSRCLSSVIDCDSAVRQCGHPSTPCIICLSSVVDYDSAVRQCGHPSTPSIAFPLWSTMILLFAIVAIPQHHASFAFPLWSTMILLFASVAIPQHHQLPCLCGQLWCCCPTTFRKSTPLKIVI